MKLPVGMSDLVQRQRTTLLERADRQNFKRGQDVEIGEGRLVVRDGTTGERFELFVEGGALLARPVDVVDADITIVARLR